ncbi:glycosyltransferase [Enterococcus sp. N342-3-1-2]
MKKALIVASVASMIEQFNMENIQILLDSGYDVTVATNFINPGTITKEIVKELKIKLTSKNVKMIQVDFPRGFGSLRRNMKIISKLKTISKNNYNLVHCHSPIGGALTRIAFKKSRTKVIYTAHGFHFFKNGPKLSWFLFYPIERYLAKYTDILLTINSDDTKIAENFSSKKVIQIPGIGFDSSRFNNKKKSKTLEELNLDNIENKTIIVSIGELNSNKNHITAIRALSEIDNNFLYLIIGKGNNSEVLNSEIKNLGLDNKVKLMGYCANVEDYLKIADCSIFISKREGLGMAGLESLASGVPLISSWVGGVKDYTVDGFTGFTVNDPTNVNLVKAAINKFLSLSEEERKKMSEQCILSASKYSDTNVNRIMLDIYNSFDQ